MSNVEKNPENLEKLSKTQVNKIIKQAFHSKRRTHYLKWVIDSELSVRFFFTFDDKPEYNGQYVLKSHYTKEYVILSRKEAIDIIAESAKSVEPKEYWSRIEKIQNKTHYRRVVVDPERGTSCFIE